MQPVRFDQQRADMLIQKAGVEIANGSDYAAHPWTDLVVVFTLEGGESQFGYVFWDSREWQAATPNGFTAFDLLAELRDVMRVSGSDSWKKCRVRITRATGKIDIDFDYDGNKWVPNMADPAGFAFSLRE